MKKYKNWIVVITLLLTAAFCYISPTVNYERSISLTSLVQIPDKLGKWAGRNMSSSLDINLEEARFGFISDALAYEYVNQYGENLVFIILDAGNFHHPKNCFISSGYELRELPDTEFTIANRSFQAHTLFTTRGGKSSLSFYWIVIDREIAHEWIEQKFKQLYFSILNKERISLMVRIDIPAKEDNIDDAIIIAQQFVRDLGQSLQPKHGEYIFGKL